MAGTAGAFTTGFLQGANLMDNFRTRELQRDSIREANEQRNTMFDRQTKEYEHQIELRTQKENSVALDNAIAAVGAEEEAQLVAYRRRNEPLVQAGEMTQEQFKQGLLAVSEPYSEGKSYMDRALVLLQQSRPDIAEQLVGANPAFTGKYDPRQGFYTEGEESPIYQTRVAPNGEQAVILNTKNGKQPMSVERLSAEEGDDQVYTAAWSMPQFAKVFGSDYMTTSQFGQMMMTNSAILKEDLMRPAAVGGLSNAVRGAQQATSQQPGVTAGEAPPEVAAQDPAAEAPVEQKPAVEGYSLSSNIMDSATDDLIAATSSPDKTTQDPASWTRQNVIGQVGDDIRGLGNYASAGAKWFAGAGAYIAESVADGIGQIVDSFIGTVPEDQRTAVAEEIRANADAASEKLPSPELNTPPTTPAEIRANTGNKVSDYTAKNAQDPRKLPALVAGTAAPTTNEGAAAYAAQAGAGNGVSTTGRPRKPRLSELYAATGMLRAGMIDAKTYNTYARTGSFVEPEAGKGQYISLGDGVLLWGNTDDPSTLRVVGDLKQMRGRGGDDGKSLKDEKAIRELRDQTLENYASTFPEDQRASKAQNLRMKLDAVIQAGYFGDDPRANEFAMNNIIRAEQDLRKWSSEENRGIWDVPQNWFFTGKASYGSLVPGLIALEAGVKTNIVSEMDDFMRNVWNAVDKDPITKSFSTQKKRALILSMHGQLGRMPTKEEVSQELDELRKAATGG